MNEFWTLFSEYWNIIWDNSFCQLVIATIVVVSFLNTLFRVLFSFDFSIGLFDFFSEIGKWIKNKFIDLCIRILGFEKVYKLGWARPGVDFFDCGQDCDKCPKLASCVSELRQEVPQDE